MKCMALFAYTNLWNIKYMLSWFLPLKPGKSLLAHILGLVILSKLYSAAVRRNAKSRCPI